jgi:hypothetical protein
MNKKNKEENIGNFLQVLSELDSYLILLVSTYKEYITIFTNIQTKLFDTHHYQTIVL